MLHINSIIDTHNGRIVSRMGPADATRSAETAIWPERSDIQRVLQFTDLHLFAEPDRTLFGVPTRQSFEAVLERAQREHWPPDAILLTGDLVHDERIEGYRHLRQIIDRLGLPCYCIPGNHDRPALLAAEVEADAADPFRAVPLGAWDLVLLDSTLEGSEGGRLQPAALSGLQEHLSHNQGRPTLVCLHHQPVPVGSRWIDTMQVDNGAALMALCERYPQLRVLLWGHVHQTFDRQQGATRLLATPSTCAQFAPAQDDFGLDDQPPGYRWLELHADGGLDTGVVRL